MGRPTQLERQRVAEILSAVKADNWERFKFLSDEPFPNEQSMVEQFNDSRVKIAQELGDWEKSAGVDTLENGDRMLMLQLPPRIAGDPFIILSILSSSGKIQILTFHQNLRLSDLYKM